LRRPHVGPDRYLCDNSDGHELPTRHDAAFEAVYP
jgi:hypothetical protein